MGPRKATVGPGSTRHLVKDRYGVFHEPHPLMFSSERISRIRKRLLVLLADNAEAVETAGRVYYNETRDQLEFEGNPPSDNPPGLTLLWEKPPA